MNQMDIDSDKIGDCTWAWFRREPDLYLIDGPGVAHLRRFEGTSCLDLFLEKPMRLAHQAAGRLR